MSTIKLQQNRKSSESFKSFEEFFDGTLGMWNTAPVDLGLKDDANSVWLQPYQVPRVHEAMLRKGLGRLVKLGVLE